jgi:peptidyl-prolyl cis-trans isomerase C
MRLFNTTKFTIMLSAASLAVAQPPATPQPPKPPATRPATPPPVKEPAKEANTNGAAGPLVVVAPETVVLSVGGYKVTRAQFEELLTVLPDNMRAAAAAPGPGRRQVGEQLAELKAIAEEARKRKLDQVPGVQELIAIQTDNVLASTLAKRISDEIKADEPALKAYYDANKNQYEQVKASHILIRFQGSRVTLKPNQKDLTDAEALAKATEIRKQIIAGGDFAAIAKAESDDTGSGAQGGSLGTFPHGKMVGPFDQAAFSLPVGQISEPVKSPFGYHIIKVEERTTKTFEEARPDIEKQMKPQLTKEAMDRIKKQLPATLDDAYFGKQP